MSEITAKIDNPTTDPLSDWSVEEYADQVMDELFFELEHINVPNQESGNKKSQKPDFVSLQAIVIPKFNRVFDGANDPTINLDKEDTSAKKSHDLKLLTSAKKPKSYIFEKLLLLAALASMVGSLVIWFVTDDTTGNVADQSNKVVPAESNRLSDAEFAQYMLRSLDVIEKKITESNANNEIGSNANNESSVVTVNPNNNIPNRPSSNVVERIYIPIYQSVPVASASAAPKVTPRPVVVPKSSPSPVVASSGVRVPLRGSPPLPLNVPPLKPVVIPSVAVPKPSPSVAVNNGNSPTAGAIAHHTLVGLVEGGQQSAALFEFDGVTHRIKEGEIIGASGWNLVAVTSKEAIIRRGGEVRSIFLGQKI